MLILTDGLKEQTKTNHQLLEKKVVGKMRLMRSTNDYTSSSGALHRTWISIKEAVTGHSEKST